uniref:Transcriptional regulator, Middle operon regulator (Mor) family n=1 Tax=Candidatus Kentrum sp. LFY TaxID=2126342 RepID=A0A450WGZ3_9GAMM|nr:MAG: Transcriptional regulator, Middle operon regulator (Mor) family [Candidatus Kentron sp. LFY]
MKNGAAMAPGKSKAPDLLREVKSEIATLLPKVTDRIDQEMADHVGHEIARYLSDAWGGMNIYFPKDGWRETHERNRRIWQEHTGKNIKQLVEKYGLSEQWTYAILRRMRKEIREERLRGVQQELRL